LQHYRIGSPLGIAIELPDAVGPSRSERHAVRRPGLRRVDISAHEGGARIRVWASAPFDGYEVEPAEAGVRITIPGPFIR